MLSPSQASLRKTPDNAAITGEDTGGYGGIEPIAPGEQPLGAPLQVIHSLGQVLVSLRDKAIEHRQQTGIEADWDEDEEYYQSIDRLNPEGDSNAGAASKPASSDGGASASRTAKPNRSAVFIPITRAYVDAGAARVADMLLPTDDRSWSIDPTPVPDEGPIPAPQLTAVGQAAQAAAGTGPMPATPGGQPGIADAALNSENVLQPQPAGVAQPEQAGMAGYPAPVQLDASVLASARTDADKRAEAAQERIDDWLTECQWHAEVRKVIEDAAKVGTGVLKGPFPVKRTTQKWMRGPDGQMQLQRVTQTVPVSKRISYRNFFPAPDCGENHQAGSHVFEYDSIGARELRKLAQDDSYIRDNIIKVLREGPANSMASAAPNNAEAARLQLGAVYPLWYFYGDLTRDELVAAGVPEEDLGAQEADAVLSAIPALVIMVNDTVIKATLSPMECGGFPYDVFRWQRRDGMIWGKGVSRQMRTPQRMLNGATRAMMDNAGLSTGPLWAMRKGWIVPIDGRNELTPRKGFYMTEQAPPTVKIQDCISFVNITSNVQEIQSIIQLAQKFGEDATGLPMLMQGQQGSAPDTVGGMQILNNNGSTVLRRLSRSFDDDLTEPHIRRYYYWLLENPGNDECKGDFLIDARGSTYLVERDIERQSMNQLAALFMQHPDVHPGRFAEELAKANRLNYRHFMLTDEEKKARDAKQPPPAPQVQAAQVREQGAAARHQATLQYQQGRDSQQFKLDEGRLQLDFELGLADLEQKGRMSADNIRAMLAATVMKLTKEAHEGHADRMHAAAERIATPAEPPGKAPAGAAFSQ